jgi:hypothetical protein
MLVAVDAPHFYAGIVLTDGVVTDAAPILRWTMGKRREWLSNYFRQKGWKAIVVRN